MATVKQDTKPKSVEVHDILDTLLGVVGASRQLYLLLGHGRWRNLFQHILDSHIDQIAPENRDPFDDQ